MTRPAICLMMVFLFLCGCVTSVTGSSCSDQLPESLAAILLKPWNDVDLEHLAETWPVDLAWGSRAEGAGPCSGTVTFSYLGRVTANECECCDVFAFSDVLRMDSCAQRLSSITIVRYVKTHSDARVLGDQFLRAGGFGRAMVQGSGARAVRDLAPQLQQIGAVEIQRSGAGWKVRMIVYQVAFDES